MTTATQTAAPASPLASLAAAEATLIEALHGAANRLDELGRADLDAALTRCQAAAAAAQSRVRQAYAALQALAGDVLDGLAIAAGLIDRQTAAGRDVPAPALPEPPAAPQAPAAPPIAAAEPAVDPSADAQAVTPAPAPPAALPGEDLVDLGADLDAGEPVIVAAANPPVAPPAAPAAPVPTPPPPPAAPKASPRPRRGGARKGARPASS